MDFLKNLYDKGMEKFLKFTNMLDKKSAEIKEHTGKNINLKVIVLGVVLVIFIAFFAKEIVSYCWTFLNSDY